jgi:hypothetical protein
MQHCALEGNGLALATMSKSTAAPKTTGLTALVSEKTPSFLQKNSNEQRSGVALLELKWGFL